MPENMTAYDLDSAIPLFKDIGENATSLLEKDYGIEKPCEVEYRFKTKDINVTNSLVLGLPTLETNVSVKYITESSNAEVKLSGGGAAVIDCRREIARGIFAGLKAEGKPAKGGPLGTALGLDLNLEVLKHSTHAKLTISPLGRNYLLSAVYCHRVGLGMFRFGGEVKNGGGKYPLAPNVSLGTSISFGKCLATPRRDVDYMMYNNMAQKCSAWEHTRLIASAKTAAHSNNPFGKLIGQLHLSSRIGVNPVEVATEVQHTTEDKNTKGSAAAIFYFGPAKDASFKVKATHDLKTLTFSGSRRFGSLTCTTGASIEATKLPDFTLSKYGMKLSYQDYSKIQSK